MSALDILRPILHKIKVRLYPNHFENVDGAYIAKTSNEKILSVEDVCTQLATRGGFTGNYGDLLDNVRQYLDEMAYQLADGFSINNGYYCARLNIGGSFNNVNEVHDHKKHPISVRFGTSARLRNIIKNIEVQVESIADTSGFIDEFTDQEEENINSLFLPGNMFAIHGHKIKLVGEDPSVGLYFVPVDDPSKAVKVERIGDNTATRITGIAPNTGHIRNRIEVRTQYSGSVNNPLKAPRAITSSFIIETA